MQPRQTKLALAPTVAKNSSGPQESSSFFARRDSNTNPGVASPVVKENATRAASAEILRACEVLRAVLILEDVTEEELLVGQVRDGVNEIIDRLQSLAGLQMMFEAWNR